MPGLRILIVEDSETSAAVLRRVLEDHSGWSVVGRAKTASEGVALVGLLRPDVVTTDLSLPDCEVFGCLSLLRAAGPTPIVVVSASTREGSPVVAEALRNGADAWFDKAKLISHMAEFNAIVSGVASAQGDQA